MIVDFDTPNTYPILYIDPPWTFKTWSDKGLGKSAQKHYSCMSMEAIANLPISRIAAKDALICMWGTDPLLDKQIALFPIWGFRYVTMGWVWIKMNKITPTPFIGLGKYTRANPEYVMIGRRGTPQRPKVNNISEVVFSPIREHSRKPDIIRTYIEQMYDGPRLEIFARQETKGWDVLGNEIGKFKDLEDWCDA